MSSSGRAAMTIASDVDPSAYVTSITDAPSMTCHAVSTSPPAATTTPVPMPSVGEPVGGEASAPGRSGSPGRSARTSTIEGMIAS